MDQKFFMHRIQEENGAFTKGIEVHETKENAILSFWGRMKTAFGGNPNMDFVSCKITDVNGNVVEPYNLTWNKNEEFENKFFLHHIRKNGESFVKDIDVCASFDAARSAYAAQMEYGYGNTRYPEVELVSCEITDKSGTVMYPFNETWVKPEPVEPEGESEEETEPEQEPA